MLSLARAVNPVRRFSTLDATAAAGVRRRGTYQHRNGKWAVRICHRGRVIHVGTYETQNEAAVAYDTIAVQLRGERAKTNFGAGSKRMGSGESIYRGVYVDKRAKGPIKYFSRICVGGVPYSLGELKCAL